MPQFLSELRFAFRGLRRAPGSALVAVVTLSLGIGLCTIAFSLFYGVMIRGLGIPEADRVRVVYRANPTKSIQHLGVTEPDVYDWRERQSSFESIAYYDNGQSTYVADSLGPERYEGVTASANLFDMLRVRPVVGTAFREGADKAGAPLTVVLGYHIWTTRYGADPGIVGRSIRVNGEAATVLGVMPSGFQFPQDADLWFARRDARALLTNRAGGREFSVAARLKDGVTWKQAQADMDRITAQLAKEYPTTNEGIVARFNTFVTEDNGSQITAVFIGMQVATIFVLLIACANVANLVLARALLRTREAAVRTALGASRLRVVLPFFAETALLALAGAGLGTAIAAVGIHLFDQATTGVGKPYYMVFDLNPVVLAFVVGLALLTTLAAAAAPAMHILRVNLSSTLKDESRGASSMKARRLSRTLVVAQMALSCALLVGAGLMTKSITRLHTYAYPFATDNVFTARLELTGARYADTVPRREFWRTLESRLQAIPGASAVALTTQLPGAVGGGPVMLEGATYATDNDIPRAGNDAITAQYFGTFDVAMLRGRAFTSQDDASALPVAIVNEEFARQYFKGVDPIGQRIRPGGTSSTSSWFTIVGVAPDLGVPGIEPGENNTARYYLALSQVSRYTVFIAVRTSGDPLALASAARQAVASIDPDLPIFQVYSMSGALYEQTWFFQVFGTLFIVFGAAALFMASVGLYGVLAFSVSRRVREIGIRMAVGASARDVIRLIVGQGAHQAGIGLAIGLAMAFGLARVLGFLMFGVNPSDPIVFGGVALVVVAVALAASWVPARRAMAVDPIVALRAD